MATLYDTKIELNGVEYGICGIDVGNSRVKIHHDDEFLTFPYDKEWKKNVQHHFRDHTVRRYLIGLSSVNPKQTTAIVKVLQRIPGHMVLNAHSLLMRNEALIEFGNVENAGIDRLLGAIGAMHHTLPPLITIDCGTAITINVVSGEKVFLGGVIFAGLNTQLFGLSKQTAAIPELRYSTPLGVIGHNTKDSLMSGVTASAVGGIASIIRNVQKTTFKGKSVPIMLTGGESEHLIEPLEIEGISTTSYPHMVTEGILKLMAFAARVDIQDSIIGKIPN